MPKYTMSDGRAFTDYRPNCDLNILMQQKQGIKNSHAFRKYLQDNAENIMKSNRDSKGVPDCVFCPVCKKALEL